MLVHIILYIFAFIGIWLGSGLAIKSVEKISHILKVSNFAVSFLILGFFTSISELSVGVNSVIAKDPEIYVGNLIGASVVIFTCLVPLLAIVTKKITITKQFGGFNLLLSLVVISTPVILAIDGVINRFDGLISIIFYLILVMFVESKKGVFNSAKRVIGQKTQVKLFYELFMIVLGFVVIFVSSRFVVDQTLYFSSFFNISPFVISLLIISIGTNIPEASLIIRSIFMKNSEVAFGDYVGSASFNTFLYGFLTIYYGKPVTLEKDYLVSLLFLIFGLVLFYYFARSKSSISRKEGILLLMIYISFFIVELILRPL